MDEVQLTPGTAGPWDIAHPICPVAARKSEAFNGCSDSMSEHGPVGVGPQYCGGRFWRAFGTLMLLFLFLFLRGAVT